MLSMTLVVLVKTPGPEMKPGTRTVQRRPPAAKRAAWGVVVLGVCEVRWTEVSMDLVSGLDPLWIGKQLGFTGEVWKKSGGWDRSALS